MFGLTNDGIPRQRVGHAVDVVPPPGVEADEARAERRADLHQLKSRLDLLDEHVGLDRPGGEPEMLLERRQNVVPQCGLFGRLDLRQIQDERRPSAAQPAWLLTMYERRIDDRRREAAAVGMTDVAIVEMQAPRAENPAS